MYDYLHFQNAFEYYTQHIFRADFFSLLKEHNLKISGSVPPVAWELFGSILTGHKGTQGYGADLDGVEIKTARIGSSFEYQYHLNSGLKKLEEDMKVDHYFCSYSNDYSEVTVYHLRGEVLAPYFFEKWIPLYKKNYLKIDDLTNQRQRFRKTVPNGFVVKNGCCVLRIENGMMSYPFHLGPQRSVWARLFKW